MLKMLRLYTTGKLLLRFKPSKKEGIINIYLEIYLNRRDFFRQSTDLSWYANCIEHGYIKPRYFGDQDFLGVQKKLDKKIEEWDLILSQMNPIVIGDFVNIIKKNVITSPENVDFYGFAQQYIEKKKTSTKQVYTSTLNNIRKNYPDGSWAFWLHLNASEFQQYYQGRHLRNHLNFVKIILHEATKQGIIYHTPNFFRTFPKVTVKKIIFERSKEDYDLMFSVWKNSKSHKRNSLAKLLFAALTGLRWVDINNLSPDNIANGRLIILLEKTKDSTGYVVNIRLSPKALEILANLKTKTVKGTQKFEWYYSHIRTDYSNLDSFDFGFKPKFHDSRRFVATEISKQTGGDIFKISKILGVTPDTAKKYVYMDNSDVDILTVENFF